MVSCYHWSSFVRTQLVSCVRVCVCVWVFVCVCMCHTSDTVILSVVRGDRDIVPSLSRALEYSGCFCCPSFCFSGTFIQWCIFTHWFYQAFYTTIGWIPALREEEHLHVGYMAKDTSSRSTSKDSPQHQSQGDVGIVSEMSWGVSRFFFLHVGLEMLAWFCSAVSAHWSSTSMHSARNAQMYLFSGL